MRLSHVELRVTDLELAAAFYTEVVGWKTQPFGDAGNYTMWVSSQGPLGGTMNLPEEAAKMGMSPHWMRHVEVDDLGRIGRARSPRVQDLALLVHDRGPVVAGTGIQVLRAAFPGARAGGRGTAPACRDRAGHAVLLLRGELFHVL